MNKQSSYKITYLTFTANLLILIEHASLVGIVDCSNVESWIMDFFRLMAVPMMSYFFFISAYLFFRGINKSEDIWKRITRRIHTLLIPYLIWNLFGGILHIIGGDYQNFNFFNFFKNSFFLIDGQVCGDGPLWYIFRLMTFFVISPFIYLIIKNKKYALSLLLLLGVLITNYIFHVGYYEYLHFFPVFIVGSFCGLNFSNEFEKFMGGVTNRNRVNCFLMIVVYVIGTIATLKSGISIITLLYPFVSIMELVYILNCLGTVKKPIHIVAGSGMFLYCAHDLVYRIARTILLAIGPKIAIINWLLLILVSMFVMLTTWIIMDKYLPSFLSMLCGGRNKR